MKKIALYNLLSLIILSIIITILYHSTILKNSTYLIVAISALLALSLINCWLVFKLCSPLNEIRKNIKKTLPGKLDYKLRITALPEIAGLVEDINHMLDNFYIHIKDLNRQNYQQKKVLTSMTEGVIAVDMQANIININQAAADLLAVNLKKTKGRSLEEGVRNFQLQNFIKKIIASLSPNEKEIMFYNNAEKIMYVRGNILKDLKSRPKGVVIVLNDITTLRKLEKVRREFVANVSHELKTPLTSLQGFIETLLDGALEDKKESKRFLVIMAKQVKRLNNLIEDLLQLSRLEQQPDTVKLEKTPLREVLAAAIDTSLQKNTNTNINFNLKCETNIYAKINVSLFEQAVINLLNNAVNYSESKKPILVSAKQESYEIIVSIQDYGIGIAEQNLPRLFERFYRIDKGRSKKLGGTGLGLAIVKHIMQVHGGQVTVTSKIDHGTIFNLHLPI